MYARKQRLQLCVLCGCLYINLPPPEMISTNATTYTSLTLSYSSQGSPAPTVFRVTHNCLKLTIPGFPYHLLPVSCGDIGFLKQILGLVLAWKSGVKVPLLSFGRSSFLQTILLSDLVGCDCPLQIVMTLWRTS